MTPCFGMCRSKGAKPVSIHHAVDVEGHKGSDGKYCTPRSPSMSLLSPQACLTRFVWHLRTDVVDTARVFPPEHPYETNHLRAVGEGRSIFFRLLRSDFVRRWPKPLSADAMSLFSAQDPQVSTDETPCSLPSRPHRSTMIRLQAQERNEEVREATKFLVGKAVPKLAALLSAHPRTKTSPSIGDELHRRGINVRHMGLLRSHIDTTTAAGKAAAEACLVEMVARTLKQLLRRRLRNSVLSVNRGGAGAGAGAGTGDDGVGAGAGAGAAAQGSAGFHARPVEAAVSFLNLVSGSAPASETFWSTTLPSEIWLRFGRVACEAGDVARLATSRSSLAVCLTLLCTMMGIHLAPTTHVEVVAAPVGYRFVHADVRRLSAIVRTSSKHNYAFGTMLVLEAVRSVGWSRGHLKA